VTHPKLAHDPLAVNSLFRILDQASGLTFVSAFSDEHRTFILTSLGNSASWNDARNRVSGLDVHTPDYFSPVPGVYYFPQPQPRYAHGGTRAFTFGGSTLDRRCPTHKSLGRRLG
jgi:hypothetical protein